MLFGFSYLKVFGLSNRPKLYGTLYTDNFYLALLSSIIKQECKRTVSKVSTARCICVRLHFMKTVLIYEFFLTTRRLGTTQGTIRVLCKWTLMLYLIKLVSEKVYQIQTPYY